MTAGQLAASLIAWSLASGVAEPTPIQSIEPHRSSAKDQQKARNLGVPFEGTPGPLNAITDVEGVAVGHTTLIRGEGSRIVGRGPVRTGVTAILPRGQDAREPVLAAWFALNGDGEITGTTWVEESGLLRGPVMITNSNSIGVVHHAVVRWDVRRLGNQEGGRVPPFLPLPVVAETWDGALNDVLGQHVTEEDAIRALEGASPGPVAEGNVGGGTGMICHGFKGGIGTASRVAVTAGERFTVGVLVQCNQGSRRRLRIAGVPVGREISDLMPEIGGSDKLAAVDNTGEEWPGQDQGSIIVVVATDAPVSPRQLKRIARRVSLGLARNGSVSGNGSGDIFLAFSTANREYSAGTSDTAEWLADSRLTPLFAATVESTEEAIVNAMVAARTMTGADDTTVHALPHDRLRAALRKYNRLLDTE